VQAASQTEAGQGGDWGEREGGGGRMGLRGQCWWEGVGSFGLID